MGYGSNKYLIEYAALREYLKPNVKNILWLYFENYYPGSAEEELNSQILMNYLKDLDFSQNLKLKQNQINEMANQMIERHHAKKKKQSEHVISFTFKFIKFIKIFNIRYLIKTRLTQLEPHQSTRPEFKETLKQANDLALKNNSKLYFVYLPEHSRYISNYDNSTYHLVKNIVDELNIPFIDSHREVFKKEKNPLKLFPFELHGHYTVEGYRKVAEAIYKFISK